MIVLDEQLNDYQIVQAIRQWYKGKVITINELRLHSVIKDDNIPTLLHRQKQATFVTINYDDFYHKIEPHLNYCIVCFRLDGEDIDALPELLRELLSRDIFATKRKRMGLVISVRGGKVIWYE